MFVSVLMIKVETWAPAEILHEKSHDNKDTRTGKTKDHNVRQLMLVDKQHREIQVFCCMIEICNTSLEMNQGS